MLPELTLDGGGAARAAQGEPTPMFLSAGANGKRKEGDRQGRSEGKTSKAWQTAKSLWFNTPNAPQAADSRETECGAGIKTSN